MEIKLNKVHTGKDLLISAIILAAGIGLYFVNAALGIFIAVCGLLMLLLYKSGFKREGDDTVLEKKALDIAHSCRQSVMEFLDGKDVEPDIDKNVAGGVIRIEAYYNAAEKVAYVQLYDFSNYTYEAATGLVELRGERASKLISEL